MRTSSARAARRARVPPPQLSDPGSEWERRELLDLGENIVASVPAAQQAFHKWLSAVRGLTDEVCVGFSGEAALTSLTLELRRLWLRCAHEKADEQLKSPLRANNAATTPSGAPIVFGYERSIQPHVLEDRCFASAPAPSGWTADHVLFSSAQSALSAILHWANTAGFWDEAAPHLTFAGNYFETQHVLNIFRRRSVTWSREKTVAGEAGGAETRTILIEPVFYDQAANVFDVSAFHRAWPRLFTTSPALVILDTTLTGPFFSIDELLEPLGGEGAPIVITFRSGLKLDQAGLEMVNVGVVSIYRFRAKIASTHADVAAELRHLRTVLGLGLTFDEISTLEAPWFLNRSHFQHYAHAVFENNAHLAEAVLSRNHLFSQILHPQFARQNCRWAKAPYSVLRLHQGDPENYRFLERVISYEAEKRGIYFDLGGSFGFRGHRFEAVVPDAGMGEPFLRIAMGARSGPSARAVVNLMSELAAYPDLGQLIARYENLLTGPASRRIMSS